MTQLALRPDWGSVWSEFRRLLRDIVDYAGVKQVAFDLDVAPSQLVNALEERDRHHFRAAWIPYVLSQAPDDRAVEFLAALRGLECVPERKQSPAEELADLKGALADCLGPELRQAVLLKAKGRKR